MTTAIASPGPDRPRHGACADRLDLVAPRQPDEPSAAYVARTLDARRLCDTCRTFRHCERTAARHRFDIDGMWAGRNHGHGMSQHHRFNERRAA